jgi:hypothetical protein
MKIILTTIFTSITLLCVGQVAILDIGNPAPRISDGVDVSVSFEKNKIKRIKGEMSPDELADEIDNQLGEASISFHTELLDTGLIKIGPFKFTINKTNFTTKAITIRVYPDLPNVTDGIWLRLIKFGGDDILILEQRISHSWKDHSGHGSSWRVDAEGVDFAGLDAYKIYPLGIELVNLGSRTSSSSVRDEVFGFGTVSYQLTKYKVIKNKYFDNKVVITKDLFYALPKDGVLMDIEIR